MFYNILINKNNTKLKRRIYFLNYILFINYMQVRIKRNAHNKAIILYESAIKIDINIYRYSRHIVS